MAGETVNASIPDMGSCSIIVQKSLLLKQSCAATAKDVSVRFFSRRRYPSSKYRPATEK